MGRAKVEMKYRENSKSRRKTYSARTKGLKKKARELSILCGVDVLYACFSPDVGEIQYWPEEGSSDFKRIMERYRLCSNPRSEMGNPSSRLSPSSPSSIQEEMEALDKKINEVMEKIFFLQASSSIENLQPFQKLGDELQRPSPFGSNVELPDSVRLFSPIESAMEMKHSSYGSEAFNDPSTACSPSPPPPPSPPPSSPPAVAVTASFEAINTSPSAASLDEFIFNDLPLLQLEGFMDKTNLSGTFFNTIEDFSNDMRFQLQWPSPSGSNVKSLDSVLPFSSIENAMETKHSSYGSEASNAPSTACPPPPPSASPPADAVTASFDATRTSPSAASLDEFIFNDLPLLPLNSPLEHFMDKTNLSGSCFNSIDYFSYYYNWSNYNGLWL